MNRLTKRNSKGIAYMAIADKLTKRNQEIESSKPVLEILFAMFQKLAHYEDLEEQGLLIKLPCKVGDIVWCIDDTGEDLPWCIEFDYYMIDQIGKSIFLTREEVEKALEASNEA